MQVARLLRASGEVLLLPQKVIAAALIYLHKFRHIARGSDPDDPSQVHECIRPPLQHTHILCLYCTHDKDNKQDAFWPVP